MLTYVDFALLAEDTGVCSCFDGVDLGGLLGKVMRGKTCKREPDARA